MSFETNTVFSQKLNLSHFNHSHFHNTTCVWVVTQSLTESSLTKSEMVIVAQSQNKTIMSIFVTMWPAACGISWVSSHPVFWICPWDFEFKYQKFDKTLCMFCFLHFHHLRLDKLSFKVMLLKKKKIRKFTGLERH